MNLYIDEKREMKDMKAAKIRYYIHTGIKIFITFLILASPFFYVYIYMGL